MRPSPGSLKRERTLNEPLAGVSSAGVSAAARRWREESHDSSDSDVVAGLLAALALAVGQQPPTYVWQLLPHPSPSLGHRLVEMLRSRVETRTGWGTRFFYELDVPPDPLAP